VAERRRKGVEDELGLTEAQAVAEARRCLRCDLETRHAREAMASEAGGKS